MNNDKRLKAFMVYDTEPENGAFLVFAYKQSQAKVICLRGWPALEDPEYIDMRATRQKQADRVCRLTTPYIEEDFEILRKAGWHGMDREKCESCGLASMDMTKYYICPECNKCKECGHDNKCEIKEKI